MLYMVEKIFMLGIRFDKVYNESAHENMKFVKLFFST